MGPKKQNITKEGAAKQKENKAKQEAAGKKPAAEPKKSFNCSACKMDMHNKNTYKQHFASAHPKLPMPEELK